MSMKYFSVWFLWSCVTEKWRSGLIPKSWINSKSQDDRHGAWTQQVHLHISEAMFVWTGIEGGTVSGNEDRPSLSHTQINTSISSVSFQIMNPLTQSSQHSWDAGSPRTAQICSRAWRTQGPIGATTSSEKPEPAPPSCNWAETFC